jgi:hypothetical protein
MDVINLSIKSIKLPADKTLGSTSYQVATNGLFRDEDIVIDIANDTENLTDIDLELDFIASDVYYARVKLHFDDSSYYGWTKPIILTKDGDGFSHNNTIIVTPKVSISGDVNNCQLGNFKITGDEFVIFTGSGYHAKTTWAIKDNSGAVIWEKKRDEHNLTEIRVPSNTLKANRLYTLEVTYISNNNMVSNPGKLIIKTTGVSNDVDDLTYGGVSPLVAENEDLKKALYYTLAELVDVLKVK